VTSIIYARLTRYDANNPSNYVELIGSQGGSATNIMDLYVDVPGPGTWVYNLEGWRVQDGADPTVYMNRRALVATVLQR
jgi:hypothetical protein